MKEDDSEDVNCAFVLATTVTPSSVHDTNYLLYLRVASYRTKDQIKKVYTDKGYYGEPYRHFHSLNETREGIMRKDTKSAELTKYE